MSIVYDQRFEALLIFNQTNEFSETSTWEDTEQARADVDEVIADAIAKHKTVTLDEHHKQYAWDFNLHATNLDELKAAAREVMAWVHDDVRFIETELRESNS